MNSGSRFLNLSGKSWQDLQMTNPYTQKPISTPEEFSQYVDELHSECESRLSCKTEKLEKALADCRQETEELEQALTDCRQELENTKNELSKCRNEQNTPESNSTFRGLILAVLAAVFIFSLFLLGWVQIKPVVDKKVENAYLAGAQELSSQLETFWDDGGADCCTFLRSNFTKEDFESIKQGTSWLDFCEVIDAPVFYHRFSFHNSVIKTGSASFQFTFSEEKLIAKEEIKPTVYLAPKSTSGSGSTSTRSSSKSDPPPAAESGMAWVPTNGGSRYHRYATCSGMKSPECVTVEEAISRGFSPCGKCW